MYCNIEFDKSKVTHVTIWIYNKWDETGVYLSQTFDNYSVIYD